MKFAFLTKLSIAAAAATMLTLAPAMAHSPGKHHHGSGYHLHHGKGAYHNYLKRKHVHKFHRHHRHGSHGHRHVKPRFYSWKYQVRKHRHW